MFLKLLIAQDGQLKQCLAVMCFFFLINTFPIILPLHTNQTTIYHKLNCKLGIQLYSVDPYIINYLD